MINLSKITPSKFFIALPIIGTLIFYTWQPISEYFFTGSFDENIMLTLESESIKIDEKEQLLTLHIKPINRGNVPVELKKEGSKGNLIVEVRKIEDPERFKWIDPNTLKLINKIDTLAKFKGGYLIEPNAYYDEIEAIRLPVGIYWIRATLNYDNDDFIDQSLIVNLTNDKS